MRRFIGSLKRGKACLRELSQMVVQFVEQNVEHFGGAVFGARCSLKRGAVFRLLGHKKIDTDADNGVGLVVAAHGFNQNAAQLVHTDNKVVWPLDLRGTAQLRQGALTSERGNQR